MTLHMQSRRPTWGMGICWLFCHMLIKHNALDCDLLVCGPVESGGFLLISKV